MGNWLGRSEYDFEPLTVLPPSYLEYIDKMVSECEVKVNEIPTWDDSFDCQIVHGNDLVFGVQGNVSQETYFVFYGSKIFLFHMIPMSKEQQTVFTTQIFLRHFMKPIDDVYERQNADIDLPLKTPVVRAALNY